MGLYGFIIGLLLWSNCGIIMEIYGVIILFYYYIRDKLFCSMHGHIYIYIYEIMNWNIWDDMRSLVGRYGIILACSWVYWIIWDCSC